MPLLVALMVVLAAVYQLQFRYEHWPSQEREGMIYEHDNLTGQTRLIQPGARVNVMARILGGGDDQGSTGGTTSSGEFFELWERSDVPSNRNTPETSTAAMTPSAPSKDLTGEEITRLEKVARPVTIPRDVVVASSAPPVPQQGGDLFEALQRFAVRQIDLNQDGAHEEIIQSASASDGLLDISIVQNGRELLFERGEQIALLPTRSQSGWADVAVRLGQKAIRVFRYDDRAGVYRLSPEPKH